MNDLRELPEVGEPMTCGMRETNPGFHHPKGTDRWRQHANSDRVCSYCGSLHFDDFARLVKASAEAGEDATYETAVQIEPSDKPYKVYVKQPGVANGMEGGIKFYMQHVPRAPDGSIAVTPAQDAEYTLAVQRSSRRFDAYLARPR